ncbi:MAG: diaminopimelate decarboxylase, partial [Ruminococcus bromii]|nr:diaminopimelate decarboxylase [Ruminococcus bromii]
YLRAQCRAFKGAMDAYAPNGGEVHYASKAFCTTAMCRIAAQEGLGLDVVSGGELYTARRAGFPMARVTLHGNAKTIAEMEMALEYGVGRYIVDNLSEIGELQELAAARGKKMGVLIRLNPGIDAHTHEFIRTGQIDSKFGFALETGEAFEAVREAVRAEHVELIGLHCHIGSQIFDKSPFVLAAEVMLAFYNKIYAELGKKLTHLNLGGGFGIKYKDADAAVAYEDYMNDVSAAVHASCEKYGLTIPKIYIEPGRSIVGEAGITLYTVGDIKTIPQVRTYVAIDGGMYDNPRYALYQSDYTCLIANRADQPANFKATIAGKCCESGDLIQENTMIQKPEIGDILAVLSTGAYNYSMASNYNRNVKPACVMIRDGQSRVIIKGETYEDLIRNDL